MSTKSAGTSHVLITLGALFTLGGATRIVSGSFPMATATADDGGAEVAQATALPIADGLNVNDRLDQVCFSAEQAAALQQDQWLFEEELEALDARQLELIGWEKELEKQTESLASLQDALDRRWDQMQNSAEEDIEHLAGMYSAMKPKDAAIIFDRMDASFGAGFLRTMRSEQAGKILAEMNPDKAYAVSVTLASRNADIRRSGK